MELDNRAVIVGSAAIAIFVVPRLSKCVLRLFGFGKGGVRAESAAAKGTSTLSNITKVVLVGSLFVAHNMDLINGRAVVGSAVIAVFVMPRLSKWLLHLFGFSKGGVRSGSAAAKWQSTMANVSNAVLVGALFAALQRFTMS